MPFLAALPRALPALASASTGAVSAAAALVVAGAALAAEHRGEPGQRLQPLVDAAQPGDTIRLAPGRHAGPVRIERSLALVGEPGAVLAGTGRGSVVTVSGDDVRIEGLEITGSGRDLPAMDSAVLVTREARRARVRGNRLVGNLFGVYLHGAADSVVEGNE